MPLTMGVDMVERSNKTKAMKKRIVKGVAGRSIVIVVSFLFFGGFNDDDVEVREDIMSVLRV